MNACINCHGEHARVMCAFCIEAALGAYFDEHGDAAHVRAVQIFPDLYPDEPSPTQHTLPLDPNPAG